MGERGGEEESNNAAPFARITGNQVAKGVISARWVALAEPAPSGTPGRNQGSGQSLFLFQSAGFGSFSSFPDASRLPPLAPLI